MYYELNSSPGRLKLEGINGPHYANLIYKGIVNVVAYEYDVNPRQKIAEYKIKALILDIRLVNEEEDFLEAVKQAMIADSQEANLKCIFKEVSKEIRYKEFNLAHWRYVNL